MTVSPAPSVADVTVIHGASLWAVQTQLPPLLTFRLTLPSPPAALKISRVFTSRSPNACVTGSSANAQPCPVRYGDKAGNAISKRPKKSTPARLLHDDEPPDSTPATRGSEADPVHNGAPEEPGSVMPLSQRTGRKCSQRPGKLEGQTPSNARPAEKRL